MQNPMRIVTIGVAALGVLLVLMPPLSFAEGAGFCRDCPAKEVPKEKDWKKCREQDTIKGCCRRYGGQISGSGLMCCWDGTPADSSTGSTTVIGARGGDVYQSATQGRPCKDILKK